MTEVLTAEERKRIVKPATEMLDSAREFKLVTAQDYTAAGDQLKTIKAGQKELAGRKKTLLDPALATVKAIRDLFAAPEAAYEQAERLFKQGLLAYDQAREAERREAQRKLDEQAARDRQRREAEERKLREQAQAAAAAGNTAKAEKLEARADLAADTAATIVAPTVQVDTPRVSGITTRETWSAVVVDFEELVVATAIEILRQRRYKAPEGMKDATLQSLFALYPVPVPVQALEPCSKFLNVQARAMKKTMRYPGVTPVVSRDIAAGSR